MHFPFYNEYPKTISNIFLRTWTIKQTLSHKKNPTVTLNFKVDPAAPHVLTIIRLAWIETQRVFEQNIMYRQWGGDRNQWVTEMKTISPPINWEIHKETLCPHVRHSMFHKESGFLPKEKISPALQPNSERFQQGSLQNVSTNLSEHARHRKVWQGMAWHWMTSPLLSALFSARNAFGPQSCNTVFLARRLPAAVGSGGQIKFAAKKRESSAYGVEAFDAKKVSPIGHIGWLRTASHLSGVTWKSWTTDHSWRSMKIKNDQFGPCYQDLAMTSNSDQRASTTHNDKQWQARTGWLVMINDYQPPSMTISVLNLAWLLKADLVPCLLPSLQRWARLRRCSSSQGSQKWRHWAQSKHSEGSQVLMHSSQRQ